MLGGAWPEGSVTARIDYKRIPSRLMEGLHRYATSRIPTGGFLRAVLENDLRMACATADDESVQVLRDLISYVRSELPSECWGSRERVAAWLGERTKRKDAA